VQAMILPRTLSPYALFTVLAAAGVLPALACGGSKKPADSAENAEGSSGSSDTADPAASSEGMGASTVISTPSSPPPGSDQPQGPLGQLLNGDPARDQKIYDAANSAPTAKSDPSGIRGSDTNAKKIAAVAKTAAPGMSPDGPMFKATLNQGDHAQADLSLKAGTCYTILGYGDKISDLDLHLMVPPGVMSAQDSSDDPAPSIGKSPDFFCPSQNTTYKLDIYAEKGGGDASVQVFSKKK